MVKKEKNNFIEKRFDKQAYQDIFTERGITANTAVILIQWFDVSLL